MFKKDCRKDIGRIVQKSSGEVLRKVLQRPVLKGSVGHY